MDNLQYSPTSKTPSVNFNATAGILEIKGNSIPEDAFSFYDPVINWVRRYVAEFPPAKTVFVFKMSYFNTSSSNCFMNMLKVLKNTLPATSTFEVKWYFEEDDEDMQDSGEYYAAVLGMPFSFYSVDSL